MNKVLIPTKLSDVAANTLKTAGYEVIQDADTPLEKQVAAHPDAVALIVRSEKVTPEIMDALPSLKLVVRAGAGYDNIDIVYARKKNVDVMNTPGANSNAVAEEVMAMILPPHRPGGRHHPGRPVGKEKIHGQRADQKDGGHHRPGQHRPQPRQAPSGI